MTIETATTLVLAIGAYFVIGAIVSVLFLVFAVARLDASAEGASWLFKGTIFLGCVMLWPYMVGRVFSGRKINVAREEVS